VNTKRSRGKGKKPAKPGFRERLTRHARTVGELGSDVVHQPRVIPGKAHRGFRRWIGHLWRLRGGGLYATGFVVTFVYLEIRTIIGDVAESDGVIDFLTSELLEFVFRFAIESLVNTVYAFLWPLYVIQFAPPWGLVGLVAAFIVFDRLIKQRIEDYLVDDEQDADRA